MTLQRLAKKRNSRVSRLVSAARDLLDLWIRKTQRMPVWKSQSDTENFLTKEKFNSVDGEEHKTFVYPIRFCLENGDLECSFQDVTRHMKADAP